MRCGVACLKPEYISDYLSKVSHLFCTILDTVEPIIIIPATNGTEDSQVYTGQEKVSCLEVSSV